MRPIIPVEKLVVTKTYTWTLDEEDIEKAILSYVGASEKAEVKLDISSNGLLRGATVTLKEES